MQITSIEIEKVLDEDLTKAIVSVTFDDQLKIDNIKVIRIRDKDKYFVIMPSIKNSDDTIRDIVRPIDTKFSDTLSAKIIAAYKAALGAQDK